MSDCFCTGECRRLGYCPSACTAVELKTAGIDWASLFGSGGGGGGNSKPYYATIRIAPGGFVLVAEPLTEADKTLNRAVDANLKKLGIA